MKSNIRFWLAGVAVAGALALGACGGTTTKPAGGGSTLSVGTDGENLAYAPVTLAAATGSDVTVTFKNNSTAQQHNWVLVKGGDDVAQKVDDEGANAGDTAGYVPAGSPDVIAAGKILVAGGSETITFKAPAPGTYTFLCTYPAHYAGGMKGVLTVK